MRTTDLQITLRVALYGVTVLTVFFADSSAAGDVVFREARGAFTLKAIEGTWSQRGFALANVGDTERQITLAITADDPNSGSMEYTRTVSIPPRYQRNVILAYRTGNLVELKEAPKNKPYEPVQSEMTSVLRDAITGKQVKRKSNMVFKLDPQLAPFAVIGNPMEHDSSSYLDELSSGQLGRVHILYGQLENLPDRWYGYSLIHFLALGSGDLSLLRGSQWEALLQWVRRGGVLILTGSERTPEMLLSPLGRVAGVGAVGVHHTDILTVSGPDVESVPIRLKWALPMAELDPAQAEVIYHANGLPLLTHRPVGQGHVFVLATPLGALRPAKFHPIWRQVYRAARLLPPLNENEFFKPAMAALNSIAGRKGPGKTLPVGIIGALMALTLIGGIALRFRRRSELVWVVLIPLGIVLGLGLYGYGKTLSDPQRLSHVGLISGVGEDEARMQQVFSFYSGPGDAEVTFQADSKGLIADAPSDEAAGLRTREVRTAVTQDLPDRRIGQNATSAFYAETVGSIGRVNSELTFDKDGLVGMLDNRLPATIEDAVLYVNRQSYGLGTLKAGLQTAIRVNETHILGSGEFSSAAVPDEDRKNLLAALVNRPGVARQVSKRSVLIGYTPLSPFDPLGGKQILRQGWSVVVWPISLIAPPSGTEVFLPCGFVDLKLENVKGLGWNVLAEEFKENIHGGELLVLARPPKPMGSLTDATATLTVGINATSYRLTVAGAKLGEGDKIVSRKEIQSFANPSGRIELTIPDADLFQDDQGRFAFSLRVERIEQGEEGEYSTGSVARWRFNMVNVNLKGIVR